VRRGLKADRVMLVFSTNDILDNQCLDSYLKNLGIWPCFQIVENTLKLVQLPKMPGKAEKSKKSGKSDNSRHEIEKNRSLSRFIKNLRLYKLIYMKLFYLGVNNPDIISIINSYGFDIKFPRVPDTINGWYIDRTPHGWRITKELLKSLKEHVEETGGQLFVVIMPSTLQYSKEKQKLLKSFLNIPEVEEFINDYNKPQRLVTAFCRDNKIPVIDLLPGFESALADYNGKASPFYFPYDGHLNPKGHRLVAELVYEGIMQNTAVLETFK
jgi:hypothetical protein